METLDVTLTDFTLRARSLLVSHMGSSLARGLERGEELVVRAAGRGWFSAYVADIGFEPADTVYRVEIGVRLTAEEAGERLHRQAAPAAGSLTKQDVLDLLGGLRAAGRTVPAGRLRREARADTAL